MSVNKQEIIPSNVSFVGGGGEGNAEQEGGPQEEEVEQMTTETGNSLEVTVQKLES
jgi:hypothetical protein